jgi:FAD/FMN-containing dehydrogenase
LVRPGSTDEVAAVVRACGAAGVPVVPQGGNTGLVGGSVPASGGAGFSGAFPVVVSMTRMTAMEPVDVLAGQVTVQAGVRLVDLQRHARDAGWEYGVDLAARDSATVGGTIATNAGGIHVVLRGMTRAQVMGIEAVLPDGSVISHLAGLPKDNTGFDLAGLLCGSEGTLGVITAARLRLWPVLPATTVALVGVASLDAAIAVMQDHRGGRAPLVAAEVFDDQCLELAVSVSGTGWPLRHRYPWLVLLEVADGGDGSGLVLDGLDDVVIGLDRTDRERLWAYRERLSEGFATSGVVHRFDVSIPHQAMEGCVAQIRTVLGSVGSVTRVGVFGHIADTNLHVLVVGPDADDMSVDRMVLEVVAQYGGSISAEHGIGRAKADALQLSRSAAEIAAMRAIKDAWDPQGLMNPGVIFA